MRAAPDTAPATVAQSVGPWVLGATILGSSMAFIDGTVVNVALPALQRDLGATSGELQWIVEAYALFLSALILVGGSLGDHLGRTRVYVAGVALFTLASVACGLAPGVVPLIIARDVQGIGGALLVPGSLASISATYSGAERGRAIGTWSSWMDRWTAGRALAAALGEYRGSQTVVLGLTHGGMAVAAEVAAALHLPLDVLVVHKIAEPGQPALGLATVAEPWHVVVNQRAVQQLALPAEWLAEAVARGIREVSRRASAYRGTRERHDLRGQRVIVVDDSAATGVTLQAAVAAVRAMGAGEVIIAVPVLPAPVAEMLRPQVDRVVCLATPPLASEQRNRTGDRAAS